ncbi:MAG: prephenate dehydratase domain-containing protein [bacterium]|nr:prephenate dehydratase domain-containing protein [bacterium]
MPTPQDRIKLHRDRIDQIDQQMIHSIAERLNEVRQIGEIKRESDLSVYDPKRELEARTKRNELAKELGIDPLRLELIFEQVVLLARDTQSEKRGGLLRDEGKKLRVGVMGGIGSFSEAAALEHLKEQGIEDFELHYPISSENVLKDLESGHIDVGIFPIENSTAGLVTESIYAASQHRFDIQDIFEFDVVHCLMALPGVKKEDIIKIMSHQQALKQCKDYLKTHFPNAELIESTDTAEGARILEQCPDEKDLAVIAPKRCAELYHLDLVEEAIQDLKINYTRFISAQKHHE